MPLQNKRMVSMLRGVCVCLCMTTVYGYVSMCIGCVWYMYECVCMYMYVCVYIHNEVLVSYKEEENPATYDKMART